MHSSSGFSRRLVIERPTSLRSLGLVAGIALLALVAVLLSGQGWLVMLAAACVVGALAGRELRATRAASCTCPERVEFGPDGKIRIFPGSDPETGTAVSVSCFWVLPALAAGAVFASGDGRRYSMILWRAELGPDDWRRLNVCLLHVAPKVDLPVS